MCHEVQEIVRKIENTNIFDKMFSYSSTFWLVHTISCILQSLTENSPTSAGIESEYDTASTNSRSDNEQDEYEDDEEDSLDDEGIV